MNLTAGAATLSSSIRLPFIVTAQNNLKLKLNIKAYRGFDNASEKIEDITLNYALKLIPTWRKVKFNSGPCVGPYGSLDGCGESTKFSAHPDNYMMYNKVAANQNQANMCFYISGGTSTLVQCNAGPTNLQYSVRWVDGGLFDIDVTSLTRVDGTLPLCDYNGQDLNCGPGQFVEERNSNWIQ
jgi:hypothetical protein